MKIYQNLKMIMKPRLQHSMQLTCLSVLNLMIIPFLESPNTLGHYIIYMQTHTFI